MPFTDNTLGKSDSQAYPPYTFNYATPDAGALLQVSGYFNGAALKLNVGDTIHAVANGVVGNMQVVSNAAGVVDCSNFAAVSVTDSN